VANVPKYLDAGINIGIGHDSADCNNSADMFEQMKWAALIHRAVHADASLMPTDTVLKMGTVNGSRALQHNTGVLQAGKKADIILVNLRQPHLVPLMRGNVSNLKAHLVYSVHGEDVETTIIDGEIVMQNRMILKADESEAIERADQAFKAVFNRIPPLTI